MAENFEKIKEIQQNVNSNKYYNYYEINVY